MEIIFILILLAAIVLLLAENRLMAVLLISAQGLLTAIAEGVVSSPLFTIFALIPIKAVIIPWLLYRASQKPVSDFVCINKRFYYVAVLVPFSMAVLLFSLYYRQNATGITAAFAGVSTGLLLIIFARSLRTQFMGMISLENGISCAIALYTSSLRLPFEIPLLLDLVLLAVVFLSVVQSIYKKYPEGDLSDFKTLKG